jgi:IK cytokine
VEVQRRYLGGDGEHSILVKGLDHSLLEQNKARAGLSTEDDDALEEAFMEATSHTPINVTKKRTREELIRDLKEQRARNVEQEGSKTVDEEVRLLEEAKQKGKFKPIGFKPIGSNSEGKKKKERRSADDVERKKKKRKVDTESSADKAGSKDKSLMPPPPIPTKAQVKPKTSEQEEPIDDDFNIFADAGEYEGIDIGDDDDDDDEIVPKVTRKREEKEESSSSTAPQRWIPDETEPSSTKPSIPPLSKVTTQSPPSSHKVASEDEAEDDQPMRLVPLSSSALPSIKDFLEMEQAAGSYDKKKKRKGKKKAGVDDDNNEGQKQKSVEAKVDRDYKRLIPILLLQALAYECL